MKTRAVPVRGHQHETADVLECQLDAHWLATELCPLEAAGELDHLGEVEQR